ncbi:metallophosphoesterase [Sphingobacterium sp. lm-10]|uniref:metallophosphoesterase n=1 Tax=Sphingobacterium sp. lm-10 TaxID=2944904 RepID=UPI0020225F03|nr:metallophosphoesterase [Sphingobacterium sp. lm-10]MCL7987231.1 metallophosphoesterase [Sphingobacterium sp. lm-10]
MRKLISTILLTAFTLLAYAQEGGVTPFEYEKQTGYSGKNIPGMVYQEDSFNFVVVGDFGRVGDYYQRDVAREMGHATVVLDADFILSVGDNFYPDGVESTRDYHWISSFEEIYKDPSLYRSWYVALGNHDYRGSVQAQIDYSKVSRRWNMPDRYYSKTFELKHGKKLQMIVIDTNPFIKSYHKNPEKYLEITEQDTAAQRQWLEKELANTDPSIAWKVVVGHHPMYSGGGRKVSTDTKDFEAQFADLFDRYQVDAYICGHEHDLQIIKPEGRYTTQYLSGAGSEVRQSGEREGTLFAATEPGFMTFSVVDDQLTVHVVKADSTGGEVLYQHHASKVNTPAVKEMVEQPKPANNVRKTTKKKRN